MRPLLAIALLAATCVFAQEIKDQRKDQDASGGATAPRLRAGRDASASSRALFDRLDKNRDGYLTGSELTSQEALTSNWLGVDRDGDGRISRNEFTAVPQTEAASVGSTPRE